MGEWIEQFSKEEVQRAGKYMKKYSTSLLMKEYKSKYWCDYNSP
jgi:hypothetical protein